jgi:hypothetical protein
MTSLGAPATSLGAPQITVEKSGRNIFFGNTAGAPGNHSSTYHSTIFQTHEFSLYSNVCIDVTIWLPIYKHYIWTGCRRCFWAIRVTPEDDDRVNSEIHLEDVIEWVWRSTGRAWLSELRDALGGLNWASLEMHLEAEIELVWRCIWRPQLWISDVHLEAMIERGWWSTWRPWSSKIGEELGGGWSEAHRVLRLHPSVS